MEPSFHNYQLAILIKNDNNYDRGKVVAIKKNNLNNTIIKRIIAIPNDTVVIKDKKLYVNNELIDIYFSEIEYAGLLEKVVNLSNGEYIVIGDNINQSKDSRHKDIGIIYENEIIGVVLGNK